MTSSFIRLRNLALSVCGMLALGLMPVCPLQAASLVAHYTFNDNAASTTIVDAGPHGYDGIFSANTNLWSTSGVAGNALFLNKLQHVDLSAQAGAFGSLTNWTFSTWVQDYDGTGSNMIFTASDGTYGNRLQLQMHSNTLSYYSNAAGGLAAGGTGGSDASPSGGAVTWTPGQWYHLTWTFDNNNLTMRRTNATGDGFDIEHTVANRASLGDFNAALGAVLIGALDGNVGPAEFKFSGALDDVQIYSGALTPTEILYLGNNPGVTLTPIPEPSTGVMALLGLTACGLFRRR